MGGYRDNREILQMFSLKVLEILMGSSRDSRGRLWRLSF